MIPPRIHEFASSLASRRAPAESFASPHVVLDTHIVMECFFWEDEKADALRKLLESGRIRAAESRDAFLELAGVLSRPQFGADEAKVMGVLERLAGYSDFLAEDALEAAEQTLSVRCRDSEDQKFLTLARASKARALVTRDKLLLKAAKKLRTSGTEPASPEGMLLILPEFF